MQNSLILMGTAQPGGGTPSGGSGRRDIPYNHVRSDFWLHVFLYDQAQQRKKTRQKMIADLKKGDKVLTNSGIIGTIWNIKDNAFIIEVDEEVKIEFVKSAIAGKVD